MRVVVALPLVVLGSLEVPKPPAALLFWILLCRGWGRVRRAEVFLWAPQWPRPVVAISLGQSSVAGRTLEAPSVHAHVFQ